MRTRVITSGTKNYASPQDVFISVLERLIEKDDSRAWAHFEYCKHTGWLRKLIAGIGPFAEIALTGKGEFELNFGLPAKVDPAEHCQLKGAEIPDSWSMVPDGLCLIPLSELQILVGWLNTYFVNVHGCPSGYRVSGWIEGI